MRAWITRSTVTSHQPIRRPRLKRPLPTVNHLSLWTDSWSNRDYRLRHCGASERKATFAPSIFVGGFTCFGQRSLDLMPALSPASFQSRAPGLHDPRHNHLRVQLALHRLISFWAPSGSLLRKRQTLVHPCRRALASRGASDRQIFRTGPLGVQTLAPTGNHAWASGPIDNRGQHGTFPKRFDTKRSFARFAPEHSQAIKDSFDHGGGTTLRQFMQGLQGSTWVDCRGLRFCIPLRHSHLQWAVQGYAGVWPNQPLYKKIKCGRHCER
jgi:hypothetical protein